MKMQAAAKRQKIQDICVSSTKRKAEPIERIIASTPNPAAYNNRTLHLRLDRLSSPPARVPPPLLRPKQNVRAIIKHQHHDHEKFRTSVLCAY